MYFILRCRMHRPLIAVGYRHDDSGAGGINISENDDKSVFLRSSMDSMMNILFGSSLISFIFSILDVR